MKRFFAYFLLCAATFGTLRAQPVRECEGLCLESAVLGREVRYSVILPAGYDASQRAYPVVWCFHGLGGDHATWIEYADLARVLARETTAGRIGPFIAVMPDGYDSYYADRCDGSFDYERMLLEELLPRIERDYRTDGRRAALGFSMGGFGAMSVALRHRDLFCAAAALSPSIRSDSQYLAEEQMGWDAQWGRIFGGVGCTGSARLTDYYRARSPYHLLERLDSADLRGFRLFIDTGDREQTLCRSNEELHRMLCARGIAHRWRVRAGGHDFAFWNESLREALPFLSEALAGRDWQPAEPSPAALSASVVPSGEIDVARFYLPRTGIDSDRRYAAVYVVGADPETERALAAQRDALLHSGALHPLVLCFLPADSLRERIDRIEAALPVRAESRMRGVVCFGAAAAGVLPLLAEGPFFSGAVLAEPTGICSDDEAAEAFAAALAGQDPWRYARLWLDVASESPRYAEPSRLHVALRERALEHEFRTRWADNGPIPACRAEWLRFLDERFHH